jgi:hypothetical protein
LIYGPLLALVFSGLFFWIKIKMNPQGEFMFRIFLRLSPLIALLSGTAVADELITLDTRADVKQTFALFEPLEAQKGVVILLPGHLGEVGFQKKGSRIEVTRVRGGLTAHHITRRTLLTRGYVVVVTAPSSDRKQGMDNEFRASRNHAIDLSHVIAYIKNRYPRDNLYIWGHSRSTVSAVNVAAANRSKGINGLILSSTWRVAVQDVPIGSVRLPVLMIHHSKDNCEGAPYQAVAGIADNFRLSTASVTRINVHGGKIKMKGQEPCHTNFHALAKVRKPVIKAAVKWMQGKEVPGTIKWRL